MVNVPLIGEVNSYVLIGAIALLAIIVLVIVTGQGQKAARTAPPRTTYEIAQLFVLVMLGIIGVGYLLPFFGVTSFKGGPLLLLMLIGVGILFLYRLVTLEQLQLTGGQITIMLLTFGLVIVALLLLPKYLPSLFSVQAAQLQSIVGGAVQSIVQP